MHCCPRPKAECNSASGHPQHRGNDSFDCCTERYEIVVLLPNSEDTCYWRKDNRLILLYKGLKGKARIPTDDLIPKNRRYRNQHSLVFQIPSASIDAYKKSFFPQSIRDWNVLPDSLISSAELSDDCVSKFTSLVRARD